MLYWYLLWQSELELLELVGQPLVDGLQVLLGRLGGWPADAETLLFVGLGDDVD